MTPYALLMLLSLFLLIVKLITVINIKEIADQI